MKKERGTFWGGKKGRVVSGGLTSFTFLFPVTFLIFSICSLAWGQTDKPINHTNKEWRRVFAFSGILFGEHLSMIKAEFNLTNEQMAAIKAITSLAKKYSQREAHNFKESVPWDSKDKKAFTDNLELNTVNLERSIGSEKFDDLCQWVGEENMIKAKIDKLYFEKTDLSDADFFSDQIFEEITNSDHYKNYKQMKYGKFKSSNDSENYFSKYESGLKLRILYELSFYGKPETNKKTLLEQKSEGKERSKKAETILNRLKQLY